MMNSDDVQAPYAEREKNAARVSANAVDECFACGRGLTESALRRGWAVHLLTTGQIAPAAVEDHPDSQGWFPLGSECAKRVPREYRGRMAV